MKRLILAALIMPLSACDENGEHDERPPLPEPAATLILECDVKMIAYEGYEITERRTYKIDLHAKTIRFWQNDTGDWVNGGSESKLIFESPTELSFESTNTIGKMLNIGHISFDRAIGAVEGTNRLRSDTYDRTSRFAGPCKSVAAPGLNNAF